MPLLVVKLVLTPLLVGGSAWVARRWGPAIGGWLISLPLTSGPVLAFVALEHGPAFAADAAVGSLGGMIAIAAFSLGYAVVARRPGGGPGPSLAVAVASFVAAGVALGPVLDASVWLVAALSLASVVAVLRLIPPSREVHAPVRWPSWDVPARIVVATALVVGITTWAPLLGPDWTGLIAMFPVYLAVLTVFTHLAAGPSAATDVLRGLIGGLFGTAAYFVVFHEVVLRAGVGPAILAAVAAALAVGVVTLGRVRSAAAPRAAGAAAASAAARSATTGPAGASGRPAPPLAVDSRRLPVPANPEES